MAGAAELLLTGLTGAAYFFCTMGFAAFFLGAGAALPVGAFFVLELGLAGATRFTIAFLAEATLLVFADDFDGGFTLVERFTGLAKWADFFFCLEDIKRKKQKVLLRNP